MVDPRISDFLILLEVAKTNSLNQAAKNLGTSPVKLLNRINLLEEYFQAKIFERSKRGMFLTADGEEIIEIARSIITALSKATLRHIKLEGYLNGVIRVGASKIAGEHVLPCIIGNFKRNNPSVNFNLEILDFPQIMEKVRDGEIDIASYTKLCGVKLLEGEIEIARDRLVVITPPDHNLTKRENITLEQILNYPLILYNSRCEVNSLLNEFFRLNGIEVKSLKVKMFMPDVSSSIMAVSEGLGLSFCPEVLAKKAKRAGLVDVIYTLDSENAVYSICALKEERVRSDAANQFWQYLLTISKKLKGNLPCILRIVYP